MKFICVGLSGSGKTVVANFFQGKKINLSVNKEIKNNRIILPKNITSTTRKPRDGEKNGIDYYFLTKNKFNEKIDNNEFVEYATVFGNLYGLTKKEYYRYPDSILIYDPKGAKTLKEFDRNNVTIIYFDIPESVSLERMINRLDKKSSIEKRMKEIKYFLDFKEQCDYVIDANKNINEVLKDFNNIILSKKR